MKKFSIPVKKYVAIVTILCLKKIHNQAIRSQASHKIVFSLTEILAEVDFKELFER